MVLFSSNVIEREKNDASYTKETTMKIKAAIITIGFVWLITVYAMLFSSVGTLLTTIA